MSAIPTDGTVMGQDHNKNKKRPNTYNVKRMDNINNSNINTTKTNNARASDATISSNSTIKRRKLTNIAISTSEQEESNYTDDDLIKQNIIPPEVLYRLKDFSLFNDAPNDFFIALAKVLRLVQYNPQEYIVKFGEPAKSMYWILRGTVGVTSTDGEAIYAELAAGSFFGEIGIMFNCPRTATVVARTKVLLGVLTKDSLTQVLSGYPKIEQIIRDEAQERLRMQEKKKSLLKMSLPLISRKVSIVPLPLPFRSFSENRIKIKSLENNNDNIFNISEVANDHDIVPGPALPPVASSQMELASASLFDSFSLKSYSVNPNLNNLKNVISNKNINIDDSALRDMKRRTTFTAIDNIDNSISIREFLCSLKMFESLPGNIMHELALDVEILRYRPMEYIFKSGEFGRDIYFIVYGEVEVINKEGVLARLTPMMYFGEFAFLSTLNDNILNPRSADIRTISDCEILQIKATTLDSICQKYPTIYEEFKNTASERINNNDHHNRPNSSKFFQKNENSSLEENNSGMFKQFSFGNNIDMVKGYSSSSDVDPIFSNSESTITNQTESQKPSNYHRSHSLTQESVEPTTATISTISKIDSSDNKKLFNDSSTRSSMFKSFSFEKSNKESRPQSSMLTMPPLNPVGGSIQKFSNFQKSNFQYATLDFRRRLSNINCGRRRSSVLNIGPFPDTIFLKIFQMLDLKTLTKCARVCLRWKQLIYLSSALFTELDLTPYCKEMNDQSIMQITKLVGSRPQRIDISNCYHVTDEGFSYMVNEIGIRGNIKELIMRNNWNLSAMAIMDLSIACKSLLKLDLSNCRKVKDDVMIRLIGYEKDYSEGCHQLEELSLGYCKYLTDRTMHHIINNAAERLVSLDLSRCTTITDNGFIHFSNKTFYKLKRLILKDCTFLSDRAVESISVSCPALEVLDLTFCCMLSDYSLKLLGYGCKNLIDLNLSFCGAAVSDYSLHDLIQMIHLKNLSIKGCVRVTREGVDMILTQIQNLKVLNLLQCSRVNIFRGVQVEPFDRSDGCNYSCLKIKPHGRIVKVLI